MLNLHIRNAVVFPGQLVIVGDSSVASCTVEEALLMSSAQNVKRSLLANSATDSFVIDNYDQLQSIMTNASIGIGSASSAWSKHLEGIEKTLKEVNGLYQQYLSEGTPAARDEFLTKRRALFAKLDIQISGMALDVGATALKIKEACSTGREQACTQAKYVEGGKLVFGVGGALVGGMAGSSIGIGACMVVLGIPTGGAGVLVCAIVGGAAGGVALGAFGSGVGEETGEILYKTVRD